MNDAVFIGRDDILDWYPHIDQQVQTSDRGGTGTRRYYLNFVDFLSDNV